MPKKVLLYLCIIYSFQETDLQADGTDLFNPLVPTARNNEGQNLLFPLQIFQSQLKLIGGFLFFAPSALMG